MKMRIAVILNSEQKEMNIRIITHKNKVLEIQIISKVRVKYLSHH